MVAYLELWLSLPPSHLADVVHSKEMISNALVVVYFALVSAFVFAEEDSVAPSPSAVFKKVNC